MANERWGMHYNAAALEIKSSESGLAKNAVFWTTFFLSLLEAGTSAFILAQTVV